MVEIIEVEKAVRSQPICLAAATGQMTLIERGFSRYGHPWDLPAIAGMLDGVCVGVLLVNVDKDELTAKVSLAWVHDEHPGLLARLLLRLRSWCKERQISEVSFTCHDGNSDMAKAAAALSAEPWTRTYRVVL